ncbi:MAG: hypothetical protein WC654_03250 [Patescibacteria group bacterium]
MHLRNIRWAISVFFLIATIYLLVLDGLHIWVFITGYIPPDLVGASDWHQRDYWFWNLVSIPLGFTLALVTGFVAYKVKPKSLHAP